MSTKTSSTQPLTSTPITQSETTKNDNDFPKQEIHYDVHGIIKMKGYGPVSKRARAKYIKVDYNIRNFMPLLNLMTTTWKMGDPDLILSVNGAALNMSDNFMERDCKDLVKGIKNLIESSTCIWIITLGFDNGVARIVGQAIKSELDLYMENSRVCCIGICSWGVLLGREELEHKSKTVNEPLPIVYYNKPISKHSKECILEPHHTHFIFCDDRTNDFGCDCDFRGRFESFLHQHMKSQHFRELVSPVIQIVINGGKNTIRTAYKALKSGTPVAFLNGTGNAADFIPEVIRKTESLSQWSQIKKEIENEFQSFLKLIKMNISEEDNKKWLLYITAMIVGYKKKIQIFNYHELHGNLDKLIMNALFTEYRDHKALLEWTMKVKRFDLAKQKIFASNIKYKDYPHYKSVKSLLIYNREEKKFKMISLCHDGPAEKKIGYTEELHHKFVNQEFQLQSQGERKPIIISLPGQENRVHVVQISSIMLEQDIDEETAKEDESDNENIKKCKLWIHYCRYMKKKKFIKFRSLMKSRCVDQMPSFGFQPEVLNEDGLSEALETAIYKDLVNFVDIFLTNGVVLSNFLNKARLETLYKKQDNVLYRHKLSINFFHTVLYSKFCCRGYCCMDMHRDNSENILLSAGESISKLAYGAFPNPYDYETELETLPNQVHTLNSSNQEKEVSYPKYVRTEGGNWERTYTEQDLFFFCLLSQRYELAKYFCKLDTNPIAAALVGVGITQSLKTMCKRRGDKLRKSQLDNLQQFFSQMAIDILNEAYHRDPVLARILITCALPHYGLQNCMSLANIYNCQEFLHHPVCQNKLGSVWRGQIAASTHGIIIFFGILLPFIWIPLIFPGRKRNQVSPQTESEMENKITSDNEYLNYKHQPQSNSGIPQKFQSKNNFDLPANPKLSYCEGVKLFYKAPITKFLLYILSYVLYLGMLTYVTLITLKPRGEDNNPHVLEYLVWIWFGTNIIEEIKVLIGDYNPTRKSRALLWFTNVWHLLDIVIYTFFIITTIIRLTITDENDFNTYVPILQSISLSLFYLRFMRFYYAHKLLGPKIIMIYNMLMDVFFFLLIYGVVLLAYGTIIQKYERQTETDWTVLKNVFYYPYWQTYGMADKDEFEKSGLTIVASVIFQLFTNVLLLNLLIAMFQNTYQKVQLSSEKLWAYHAYNIVHEFKNRTWAPPPFSLIFSIVTAIVNCNKDKTEKYNYDFVMVLKTKKYRFISIFAQKCLEDYLENLCQQHNEEDDVMDSYHLKEECDDQEILLSTSEKVSKLSDNMEELRSMMSQVLQKMK